ncbi:MAG: NAD(P)H-quinone oxidoreductase [Pseudomonadota bacterium]
MPAVMRVVEIARPGGPDVLTPAMREVPRPGPGEILIKLAAAGVNRPDALQRAGAYDPPPDASDLPGLEGAGYVAALGPGVSGLSDGDAVTALLPGGGYAEYALAPASHALPVPSGLELEAAAALPETFFTVWSTVFERGGLRGGERFLVHGGSSGIGTTAIQLAAARGARVFTTAGNDTKCRACEALGAELAVNHRDADYVATLREAVGGIDLSLNMVGGSYLSRDIKLLSPDGRLVMIAFLEGPRAELNFAQIMAKRLTVTGATLRPQSVAAKARMARALKAEVWPLIEAGRIHPVMAARFPLEEAAAAHRLMETSTHIGKIVLTIG